MLVDSWILTSRQPLRVTSRERNDDDIDDDDIDDDNGHDDDGDEGEDSCQICNVLKRHSQAVFKT